jgi:uncharacterized membrane protein SpoIIM required for sporulation
MRETNFIKQNKAKWRRFETMLKLKQRDPKELSKLFIQITDDLSYSRTFYKNRSVRVYLNHLAQQIFYSLYKSKKTKKGGVMSFWSEELPQLMYESRGALLMSFSIFMLAALMGVVSCYIDNDFPRVILGDSYVDATIRNIERGDPMAVYKQQDEFNMMFYITFNNIMVAFRTFLTGLLTSVGTIGILIQNGVMLGSFQYFFYAHGELRESLLTIWIHGTIEISAIIIAGAAGITLGNGIVFPGTYSRMQSIQKSALRGLKIMLGIVPLFIMAGFIEGFVTRYTDAPDVLRLGIILASLSFILLYFVWYPSQKNREGFKNPLQDTKITPNKNIHFNYGAIQSSGEIFVNSFAFYRENFAKLFKITFILSTAYFLSIFYRFGMAIPDHVYYREPSGYDSWLWDAIIIKPIENLGQFWDYQTTPFFGFVNTIIFGTIVYLTCYYYIKASDKSIRYKWNNHLVGWLGSLGVWGIFNTVLWYASMPMVAILSFFIFPILLLWLIVMLKERKNSFSGLARTIYLFQNGFSRIYNTFFAMLLVSFLISLVFNSQIVWQIIDIIGWNLDLEEDMNSVVFISIQTFIFAFIFCITFPLLMISIGFTYASLKQICDADDLKAKIKLLGLRNRAYGLERE